MRAKRMKLKGGRASAGFLLLPYLIAGCSFTVPDQDSVFQNARTGGTRNGGASNGGHQAGASAGSTGNLSNSGGKTSGAGAGASSTLGGSGGTYSALGGTGGIETGGATSGTSAGGTSSTVATGTGGIGGATSGNGGTGASTTETGGTGGTAGTASTGPTMVKLCGTATADSEQISSTRGNHLATDGNDGNMSTRWTAADGNLGHYWTLDMGCEQSPAQIVIYWEYPSAEYANPYGIAFQVSQDGQTYTTVFNVEQSGLPVTLDVVALAAGTGGAGTAGSSGGGHAGVSGLGDSAGAGTNSAGASGTSGGTSGGTRGGGAQSGGANGVGGTSGTAQWNGSTRYFRIVVNKLPPISSSGKATWAGFYELQVYAFSRNACGVTCP